MFEIFVSLVPHESCGMTKEWCLKKISTKKKRTKKENKRKIGDFGWKIFKNHQPPIKGHPGGVFWFF